MLKVLVLILFDLLTTGGYVLRHKQKENKKNQDLIGVVIEFI